MASFDASAMQGSDELAGDCEMAEIVMREIPDAFRILPPEVFVGFIRVNRHEKKREEHTLAAIKAQVDWDRTLPYRPYEIADCILSPPPPRREEFQAMYGAGPIGNASTSHAVVLERIGAIPPHDFVKALSTEDIIHHGVFNRQAAFAYTRALSHIHATKLRQVIVVVDLKGFSTSHFSSSFLAYVKHYLRTLLNIFPEAASVFYLINTPAILRGAWYMIYPCLDKETIEKTKILGGPATFEPLFQKLGVRTDAPISECRPSWEVAAREAARLQGGRPPPPYLTKDEAVIYAAAAAAASGAPASSPTAASPPSVVHGLPEAEGTRTVQHALASTSSRAAPAPGEDALDPGADPHLALAGAHMAVAGVVPKSSRSSPSDVRASLSSAPAEQRARGASPMERSGSGPGGLVHSSPMSVGAFSELWHYVLAFEVLALLFAVLSESAVFQAKCEL